MAYEANGVIERKSRKIGEVGRMCKRAYHPI